MSADPPRLPAPARWLLRLVLLGDRRADVEADLAELFHRRVRQHGRAHAIVRLLGDAASLLSASAVAAGPRPRRDRGPLIASLARDLRGALRLVRRRPGVIGGTIAGLAVAIAVCTTVFTILNASVLRPYGMADPASVVRVHLLFERGMSTTWPYGAFVPLHDQARLARVEAELERRVRVSLTPDDEDAREDELLLVSGGYLETLGARAALGRILVTSDDRRGATPVVVLNHRFWTRRLGADAGVIGRTIWLSGEAATIVGVLEPGFTGPDDMPPAVWAPLGSYAPLTADRPLDRSSTAGVDVIARVLAPADRRAAAAELSAIAAGLDARIDGGGGRVARVTGVQFEGAASPLDGSGAEDVAVVVSLIFVVVGLVLALACANVANLLLAGAASRTREIGIRLAMGATTRRIARQLLSESLLIGAAAGVLGLVLSLWLVPVVTTATGLPDTYDLRPDGRVLLFAAAVALASGVGAGLAPARHGARADLAAMLKSDGAHGGTATGTSRLRRWFIGLQAAASIVLLVVAALFTRAAVHTATVGVGFDADRLIAVTPELDAGSANLDPDSYLRSAMDQVRAIPGVESAALVRYPPLGDAVAVTNLDRDGVTYALLDNRTDAAYFETAGLPIVRGRAYTAREVAGGEPVAVISEHVVREFFGSQDPIGASLGHVTRGLAGVTVVGVVREAVTARVRREGGTVYRPLDRESLDGASMLVRAPRPPAILRDVARTVAAIDPGRRPDVRLVQDAVDRRAREPRILAGLSSAIAAFALVLAVLGMHGVTAFVVGERSREISVRLAIGGSAGAILRLLIRQSLTPVAIGLTVGLVIAVAGARFLAPGLAGVSPNDPLALMGSAGVLLAAALAAVMSPVRRAALTDPAAVLRA